MTHFFLPSAGLLRQEDDATAQANLLRKGWQQLPDPEVAGSEWNGTEWVAPPAAPVLPDYEGFYASFLNSNLYQAVLVPILLQEIEGSGVLGRVLTIVGLAMQDAMGGRVPLPESGGLPNSLQSAIWLLMGVIGSTLQSANIVELQGLLDTYNLSDYYTLRPPEPEQPE